jgi:hypothetical protein
MNLRAEPGVQRRGGRIGPTPAFTAVDTGNPGLFVVFAFIVFLLFVVDILRPSLRAAALRRLHG